MEATRCEQKWHSHVRYYIHTNYIYIYIYIYIIKYLRHGTDFKDLNSFKLYIMNIRVCVCVCVCTRVRERACKFTSQATQCVSFGRSISCDSTAKGLLFIVRNNLNTQTSVWVRRSDNTCVWQLNRYIYEVNKTVFILLTYTWHVL